MELVRTIINDKELILPIENGGMLEVRNYPFEVITGDNPTHTMDDFLIEFEIYTKINYK